MAAAPPWPPPRRASSPSRTCSRASPRREPPPAQRAGARARLPFLAGAALTPVLARSRIDRLGSRAREVSGDLTAHAVDSVQGLGEIVAFRHARARGEEFGAKALEYLRVRMPLLHDLALQTSVPEVATGLGGLAVVGAGAALVAA